MSQKGLSNLLKSILIGIGICGLVIYFYFLPVWGRVLVNNNPQYSSAFYPWLIFLWITGIPCYLVLFMGWKIATEIGKDNSFSAINAKLLKNIAFLAAFDSVFLFIGSGILFALNMSSGIVEVLAILVTFAGTSVTVVAGALSHLVYKAASIQEENELTI